MLRPCQNRPLRVRKTAHLRGSIQESEREDAMLANWKIIIYVHPLNGKWSSNSEHSCSWMSHLLNCSAHLKSTAKTRSWMQRLLWSLKSGLSSSLMQCGKWDFQLLVASPWRARAAVVKSIFPFQCDLWNRRRLWNCISVCFLQQLSSQHEVTLFLLLPGHTSLLSIKADIPSIPLLTSLCSALLSELQRAPCCSTVIYNMIIWR